MLYDYSALCSNAKSLSGHYRFVDLFSIGETVSEKKVYCLKIGVGRKKLLLCSAISGLEYNASKLLMSFLESFADAFSKNIPFFSKNPAEIFSSLSLYFIPMINPDGVDIALHGLDITDPYHRRLISLAGIHSFSKVWQANANGVDLRYNFSPERHSPSAHPAPFGFPGAFPGREPETEAVSEFIKDEDFHSIIYIKNINPKPYYDYSRSSFPILFPEPDNIGFPKKSIQVELEPELYSDTDTFTALCKLSEVVFDEM